MKKDYYIDKHEQLSGKQEVHDESCPYLPSVQHRIFLGAFTSGEAALSVAKLDFTSASTCKTCSPDRHTN